jgi:hypothetical protein
MPPCAPPISQGIDGREPGDPRIVIAGINRGVGKTTVRAFDPELWLAAVIRQNDFQSPCEDIGPAANWTGAGGISADTPPPNAIP